MKTKNLMGLEAAVVKPIIESLNDILANRQVYYTNLRGLHWDIVGDKFFELHELYEEYYNHEAAAIDEVAERIAMLGGHPENRFSQYIKQADIKETHGVSDWEKGLKQVIASMNTLHEKYKKLFKFASEAGDSATISLAGRHLNLLEMNMWKLRAYMSA